MEERFEKCANEITQLIEVYGKTRFAVALIRWYGLKSLIDNGELEEIKKLLNQI